MTEGRRQRPDNKGFKEIFEDLNKRLNEAVAKNEAAWKATYQQVVAEVTKSSQPQKPADAAN